MPDDYANDLIPIKYLARELVRGGFTDEPTEYARIYRGCLSARFPAEQDASGHWAVRRRHQPAVAAALGLKPPDATAPPRRARRTAAIAGI
jgi:hypothetical protein